MITTVSGLRVATEVRVGVAAEFYYPGPAQHGSAPDVPPTVDDDRLAGDVVGLHEINHRTHDIVHGSQPFERCRPAKPLADLGVPPFRQENDAGRDRVHPN